jgi:hypothetical protein
MVTILVLGVIRPPAAQCDELAEPRSTAETFLKALADGPIPPAYDALFKGSPLPADKPQAVEAVKRQTEAMLPVYGKPMSFELMGSKSFGTHVARLTYIQILEKHPVVWQFWFYKPKDAWYVSSVLFNDQFKGLPD